MLCEEDGEIVIEKEWSRSRTRFLRNVFSFLGSGALFTHVCSELPTIGFLQGLALMSFRISFHSGIVLNSSFRFFQIQAHAFHERGEGVRLSLDDNIIDAIKAM